METCGSFIPSFSSEGVVSLRGAKLGNWVESGSVPLDAWVGAGQGVCVCGGGGYSPACWRSAAIWYLVSPASLWRAPGEQRTHLPPPAAAKRDTWPGPTRSGWEGGGGEGTGVLQIAKEALDE